jgi:hypothetical protein
MGAGAVLSVLVACTGQSAGKLEKPGTAPGAVAASEFTLPEGYLSLSDSRDILAQSQTIELTPNLDSLSEGERACIEHLIAVGRTFQELYETSRHPRAREGLAALRELDRQNGSPEATQNLETLHWMFRGPMAVTVDGARVPIYPIGEPPAGGGVYPEDASREELENYLEANPEQRDELLHLRSVVRRADAPSLSRDLKVLEDYPQIASRHPKLRARLETLAKAPDRTRFYGSPYSVAWPEALTGAHEHLGAAAAAIEADDPQFATYLRARAEDLLRDSYDEGDAAWVRGRFKHINAQIGAYETYDDTLFGTKAYFSLSILLRDEAATRELSELIGDLQGLEDSLPYRKHKKVRSDIPVGVYAIIADFGQARGGNTASILPNEAHIVREHGRTILLRASIMRNQALFESSRPTWVAAVGEEQGAWLTPDGNFQRTLWHEIGHYLGVDADRKGRPLSIALQQHNNTLEEMKADLVSLHVAHLLHDRGKFDDDRLRSIRAAGIRRTLQRAQPGPHQPYQTMQLMQMNYFLEHGLLEYDAQRGELLIHVELYREVVDSLLAEVLKIQRRGSVEEAQAFIDRYTSWKDDLHEALATRMNEQRRYRYTHYRYGALE